MMKQNQFKLTKRILALVFCVVFMISSAQQTLQEQPRRITGVVVDDLKAPVPGATVIIEGTNRGTITDVNGQYSILAGNGQVIKVSMIGLGEGYATIEQDLNTYEIALGITEQLNAVVAVGYGRERKQDLTGSVAVLPIKDISNIPVPDASALVQNRVSGVQSVSSNQPGSPTTLRIRGYSTIGNNEPLYIIDGVPTQQGLSLINSNDIESLQILKDASSSTIYGSRAANGVVIVTTKLGKKDNTLRVNFNSNVGIQYVSSIPSLLNAQQYGEVLYQTSINDGTTFKKTGYNAKGEFQEGSNLERENHTDAIAKNTNWYDEIYQTAVLQNYNLGIGKGSENSQWYFSLGYFDQEGVLSYTDYDRITARFNSSNKFLDGKITIGESVSIARATQVQVNTSGLLLSVVQDANRMVPSNPVYDINNELASNFYSDRENPVGVLMRNKDNREYLMSMLGDAFLKVKPIEKVNLEFTSKVGFIYNSKNMRDFDPSFTEFPVQTKSNLTTTNSFENTWVWDNHINYQGTFNKSKISAMIGTEAISFISEGFSGFREGDFPTTEESSRYLNSGSGSSQLNTGDGYSYSLASYFGRINYTFDTKYLFSATFRRDGTSKLKGSNKWGNFWALSAGWRISKESFMDFASEWLDEFKLRGSWGQTGNQDIPTGSTINNAVTTPVNTSYPILGNNGVSSPGYRLARVANENLKWETTTQYNLGFDLNLWRNLHITFDWYTKNTVDLIYEQPLPDISGGTVSTKWVNAGEMLNQGIEIGIEYNKVVNSDFDYSIFTSITQSQNELVSLEGVQYIEPSYNLQRVNFGQEVSRTNVGGSIGSFYGYEVDGIFQSYSEIYASPGQNGAQPGDFKYKDINNDGVIDAKDRTEIGSPLPKVMIGLGFSCNYKNWTLSTFFSSSFGNKVYQLTKYQTDFLNQSQFNKSTAVLDAWSPSNTGASLSRLTETDPNNNTRPSSYYVQNGDYVRLQNMQIGYNLPTSLAKQIGLEGVSIYLSALNLFTITGYEGSDPAVGVQNGTNLDIGVDRGAYPVSTSWNMGVNIKL